MLTEALIGSWRMVDWKVMIDGRPDGNLPPLGLATDGGGILLYTREGMMSAMLSSRTRALFEDGSLDGGTVEEKAAAFGTLICYAGTYEVDEGAGEVTHVVEYATNPNLVGQRMRRICKFEGGRLKLDTPSMMMGGVSRESYIVWEKAGEAAPDGQAEFGA